MSAVAVYSYTHSVTYVTDNILKSLKDIIVLTGLDPSKFVQDWKSNHKAIRTWIESQHLERVTLEIYDPHTDKPIVVWNIDVIYSWAAGDGSFWTDTDQLRHAIEKKGLRVSEAKYDLKLGNKPGRPDVDGWGPCSYRSTDGMVRQSLGSTIEHSGLGAQTSYWRQR